MKEYEKREMGMKHEVFKAIDIFTVFTFLIPIVQIKFLHLSFSDDNSGRQYLSVALKTV